MRRAGSSALLPIEAVPGVAQVSDGWRALGRIEVQSHDTFAYDELWHAVQRAGAAWRIVGLRRRRWPAR